MVPAEPLNKDSQLTINGLIRQLFIIIIIIFIAEGGDEDQLSQP